MRHMSSVPKSPPRGLHLGPRTRRAVRAVAALVNPLVLLAAGRRWMPIVGVLHHRGRKSGRTYVTPLGMRRLGDSFYMPRTFRSDSAWYRNVSATGSAEVRYLGRDYSLVAPEVVDYPAAAPAFPAYERIQFRLLGINEFVRMRMAIVTPSRAQVQESEMQQPRNGTAALIVIAFAQLMVVLDTTIVNVALPSVQRALHFTPSDLEWVVNAYALAFGGLLLLGGRAGDLFGRRRMFIAGVLLFAIGSLAGGLAASPAWLIVSRIVQGAGGAVVAPTALSLIADTFREGAERNRALGLYAGAAGSGGAIGLIVGGLIASYLSWRWVLFVNVPIAVVLAVAAPRVLAGSTGRSGHLDLPGAISVTTGMTLLVYGLSRAATHSWTDAATIAGIGSGLALLTVFLLIELRSKQPLMPLRVLAARNRAGAYALRMVAGATTLSVLFFLTQFAQNVLGYSPLQAGVAFLPLGVGVVITAQVTSRLVGRIGPKTPISLGALTVTAALLWLSRLTPTSMYVTGLLGPLALLSIGLGMIFFPTTVVAVSGTGRHESGLASAMLNVSQQIGGSVGLAIFGSVAAGVTAAHLPQAGLDGAIVAGFTTAFQLAALVALAGFVVAWTVIRAHRPQAEAREGLPEAA
jgi:EmrB/QacA subfamily drug resistance transporter/deazaflavin-dependent oxidoreductase (nitroreductase family)